MAYKGVTPSFQTIDIGCYNPYPKATNLVNGGSVFIMVPQTAFSLSQVLDLAGKLDDAEGDDAPRVRFRNFLSKNVLEVGQVRDYVEECLANSGDQYNRALQDLVNYIGHFLGFDVTYGRYQGVVGQVGFDGLWTSPTGFHVVVEVKTTNVYAIKIDTLIGYIDKLISSEKKIASWDVALGLYAVGRPDVEIRQLDNAIVAEKRTHQLRIITVDALLSLAELMKQYGLTHSDILRVLRPSGPTIDWVVKLMTRMVGEHSSEPELLTQETEPLSTPTAKARPTKASKKSTRVIKSGSRESEYWLTPVRDDKENTAEEVVRKLVGESGMYAFGEHTPGRKRLKKGDWICFHASRRGIVGHAQVMSSPEKGRHVNVRYPEKYQWLFRVSNSKLYLEQPVVIDATIRGKLDAFEGKDPNGRWAWFVQATHTLSKHDFEALTRSLT